MNCHLKFGILNLLATRDGKQRLNCRVRANDRNDSFRFRFHPNHLWMIHRGLIWIFWTVRNVFTMQTCKLYMYKLVNHELVNHRQLIRSAGLVNCFEWIISNEPLRMHCLVWIASNALLEPRGALGLQSRSASQISAADCRSENGFRLIHRVIRIWATRDQT